MAARQEKQESNFAPADVTDRYGLGVHLDTVGGHARVEHGGASAERRHRVG